MGPVAARQGHGDGARLVPGRGIGLQLGVRIRPGEENEGQKWLGSATAMGPGRGQAGTSVHGWAWLSGAHGRAGQGCGQLEISPAAASLGQGLMAPGG